MAWLLIRILLLLLVWVRLAIRSVVLVVVVAILVIAIIVLLIRSIAVVIIAGLVVLYILRLGVAVLVIIVIALIIGAIVGVVILRALLIVSIALLSIGGLEMFFECTCKVFKTLWNVRSTMWARNTAMCIFIIFVAPEEFFRIAELDSRIGIELEPSTEKS